MSAHSVSTQIEVAICDGIIWSHSYRLQASWRAASVSCGGHLAAQPYSQTFTSPGYPDEYPNGLECVWTLEAPPGQLISLYVPSPLFPFGPCPE